jgi:hypothetical protein
MGSANGLPHSPEGLEHIVDVTEFWMAGSRTTIQQYQAVMVHNPSLRVTVRWFSRSPRRLCELGRSMRILPGTWMPFAAGHPIAATIGRRLELVGIAFG